MPLTVWLTYVMTILVLMSVPGPSQLLMLSTSINHGTSKSMMTAFGDLTANSLQMLAVSLGLTVVLTHAGTIFLWIKWLGVAYLAYLGIKMILSKPKEQLPNQMSIRMSKSYWQGFITSASNPKAIIFFSALFPQFINGHQGIVPQFFLLSITYLIMDGLFLSLYAYGARRIGHFLKRKNKRIVGWLGGVLMISAAIVLARKPIT